MMLRLRRLVCVLVGAVALWLVAPEAPAFAQDAPAAAKKPRKKKPRGKKQRDRSQEAAAAPKPEPKPADKGTSGKGAPAPTSASNTGRGPDPAGDAARRAAQDAAQGVDTEIVKEGETSVKMMQFSGLDIEGRLKSPQLLYFVNRVRAEFDRPRLPHRSFMPEVERSTRQEPLR